jgi:hypothetical protein
MPIINRKQEHYDREQHRNDNSELLHMCRTNGLDPRQSNKVLMSVPLDSVRLLIGPQIDCRQVSITKQPRSGSIVETGWKPVLGALHRGRRGAAAGWIGSGITVDAEPLWASKQRDYL